MHFLYSIHRTTSTPFRRRLTQWAQAAVYSETGDASQVLRVVRRQLPALSSTGVLVRMLAAPVNPSDLNQIEGTYPVKGRFADELMESGLREHLAVGGNEGVGVVEAVGSSVEDLRTGDWVVPRRAGEFGTWCTHTVVGRDQVAGVPAEWRKGVDALTVGSMKVNPSTAYRLLRDFADLSTGDWVIQNGANSGVGRAVIQMARTWGIRTINVVRDREEYAALEDELQGMGADVVVKDSELGSDAFKARVKALGGIKLGLNCVGGRMGLAMTKHLAAGAPLVSYGGMSRQPVVLPTSLLLFKDIAARGFWMNRWYESHGDEERDA
ncbi:mitochondrial 2-enoyl thioester reductase, partial [Coemansia furcata]